MHPEIVPFFVFMILSLDGNNYISFHRQAACGVHGRQWAALATVYLAIVKY
jgi:hypothetical protein